MSADRDTAAASGADDHLRIEVARGGQPTAEQLAALTAALLTATGAPPDQAEPGTTLSGWQCAALAQGVGGRPIAERAELEHPGGRR